MDTELIEEIATFLIELDPYEFGDIVVERSELHKQIRNTINENVNVLIGIIEDYNKEDGYYLSKDKDYIKIMGRLKEIKMEKSNQEMERMLINGTFIKESIFNELGKMIFRPITSYELLKKFIQTKGNSLFNIENEICYFIEYNNKGIRIFEYADKIDYSNPIVFSWEDLKDRETEDIYEYDNFYSLDGTPFGVWEIFKLK